MLAGHEITAAVVVSEEEDDLILGFDWLGRHRCRWSFAQNLIEIDGRMVTPISRPRRSIRRRMYAAECHVISTGHTLNVPATMAVLSLRPMSDSWIVKPQSLETEMSAAKKSMRDQGRQSAVQAMNVSDSDAPWRI